MSTRDHSIEGELRRLEDRVFNLPVADLERRVAALEQGLAQQSARVGSLCIRTWNLSAVGNAGLPLPGVPIAYGPYPYDPLTAGVVGTTDAFGAATVLTVDRLPLANPHFYLTGPRWDPVAGAYFGARSGVGACGQVTSLALNVNGNNSAVASGFTYAPTFPTPWPVANNLVTTISSLGLTALSLTNVYGGTANYNGWGTASVRPPVNTASYVISANYPGGGAPGCAANATLPLVISLLNDGTNPAALIFEYHQKGGAPPQNVCPFAGSPYGAGGGTLQYDVAGGSTIAITGDGNTANGLTITVTPSSGTPPLFPTGNPTFVLTEV